MRPMSHAQLHLHHLWHAVRREPAATGRLHDLPGTTPVRQGDRPAVDDSGPAAADQPQLDQVQGTGADRHWHRAALRHRPAGLVPALSGGNILWDCLPLLDQAVVECLKALGGVSAIAISHPHYYSSMVEWSRAFGGVPIYLHADDHQWVMRPDKDIIFWRGETNSWATG